MKEAMSSSPEAAERTLFPQPSFDDAQYFLRELGWGDHIICIEMSPSAGDRDMFLYNFKEAVQFLRNGTEGMHFALGSRASISWIDIDEFIGWLRRSVTDTILANKVEADLLEKTSYYEKLKRLGYLMEVRYVQLMEVILDAKS